MVFRMCASQTMDLSFHQMNSKRFVINGYLSTTHLHQGIPKATERQSKLSKLPRPSSVSVYLQSQLIYQIYGICDQYDISMRGQNQSIFQGI